MITFHSIYEKPVLAPLGGGKVRKFAILWPSPQHIEYQPTPDNRKWWQRLQIKEIHNISNKVASRDLNYSRKSYRRDGNPISNTTKWSWQLLFSHEHLFAIRTARERIYSTKSICNYLLNPTMGLLIPFQISKCRLQKFKWSLSNITSITFAFCFVSPKVKVLQ